MSADFYREDMQRVLGPYPLGMEEADHERFAAEPCRMAEAAEIDLFDDYNIEGENRTAADDDRSRVLQYISDMCLDRPCPNCQSEVIDKPQCDLRQCRACGELWGFDDTQTMDEFVREYGRMEPCQGCGTSSLDDFEIAARRGRQELICLKCKTVQDTRPAAMERDEEFEFLEMQDGRRRHDADQLNGIEEANREDVNLNCPNCPDLTNDFFEKVFERNVLVRATCPSCSRVVFDKATQTEAAGGERRAVTGENEPGLGDGRHFFVRLLNEAQQERGVAIPERNAMGAGHLFPRMGEAVGMTIGTAMGTIILKDREQATATGTVGAVAGKAICNALYKSAACVGLVRR